MSDKLVSAINALIEANQLRHEQFMVALRESSDRTNASIEQMNQNLGSKIDDLAVQIGNQSQSIDRLEQAIDRQTANIDRLERSIERTNANLEQRLNQLATSIEGHLAVAQAQSANIAELTKLVAVALNKLAA